jgi:hypothetical protein
MKRVVRGVAVAVLLVGVAAGAVGARAGTKAAPPPDVYTGEADAYPDHLLGYVTLPAADLYAPHAKGTIGTVGGRPYGDALAAIADAGFLVTSAVQGGLPNANCNPDAPPCANQIPSYVNSVYPTGPGPKDGCLAPQDRGSLCDASRLSSGNLELLRSHADADCKACPGDPRPTSVAEVGVSGYEVPGQLKVGAQFARQRQYIDEHGLLRVVAESVLKDVVIGGVLRIASLSALSEARGGADDRTKKASSRVSLSGVFLGGQLLEFDERGLRVGSGPAAVDPEAARAQARALLDQLAANGIEVEVGVPVATGTKKPGKVESVATALKIHFRPTSVPQSLSQDYVLGYARSAITASAGTALLPLPDDRLVATPLGPGPAVVAGGGGLSPSLGPAPVVGGVPEAPASGASRRRVVASVRGSAFGVPDPRAARRLASVMWVFAVAGLVTPVAALALRGFRRSQRGEWRR